MPSLMSGSMRQRSPGSWELRVFAGTNPETQQRRYRTATVRGNCAEAERELAALVASVRSERAVGVSSPMSELLEAWFAIASTSWAPTTIRQTRSVLDRYLHPHIGSVAVGALTPAAIDAFYAELHARGGLKHQPLSSGTIARVHVVLRSSLAQTVRWGWIWDNPAERAHRITAPRPELCPPTVEELSRLLDHLRDDPLLQLFVMMAAFTGARRAQLLALRWRNISLEVGRVAFTAGWVEGPNGPVLADTKTKRTYSVDLDPGTLDALRQHAERRGAADARSLPGDGFVFSDHPAGVSAWKPNRATKAFLRARRAAGLREFRLHDLRHFMATQMLDAGVPLPVVSRRLDHRRVSTTWTATPTPYLAETRRPPRNCGSASMPSTIASAWGVTGRCGRCQSNRGCRYRLTSHLLLGVQP